LSPASVYVYYKVDPQRLEALRGVIESLFDAVRRGGGVQGRWQRRRDDPATYMEIYSPVPDLARFEALLARECERLGVSAYLAPGSLRRVETFIAAE
jgi:hypothetical protein